MQISNNICNNITHTASQTKEKYLVFFINIFLCRCIYRHHQQTVSPKKNDDIGRNTIPNEDPHYCRRRTGGCSAYCGGLQRLNSVLPSERDPGFVQPRHHRHGRLRSTISSRGIISPFSQHILPSFTIHARFRVIALVPDGF